MHKVVIKGNYYGRTRTLPDLNDYLHECARHPQMGAKMKRDYQMIVCNAIRTQLPRLTITNPIIIHYNFYEPDKQRDNSGYNSEEEFAKLPEACQRAVGTAANLKEWALMDSDQVATIEQSHFIRNYRTSVQRMKEEARLPENVRMLIADMGKKHAALMEKAVDPQIEMQKIEVPEEKTEPPSGMSNETRKRLDEMYEKFGRK